LGLSGHSQPLVYHSAELRLGDRKIALDFGQQQQNWLDSVHFEDGSSLKEIPHGKGKVFWASHPVELSEDLKASADLYSYVSARLNIAPLFSAPSGLPAGVLAFPNVLADSLLYVFVSDSASDAAINIRDQTTGVQMAFSLPTQHAALVVIGKKERRIVAQYGF